VGVVYDLLLIDTHYTNYRIRRVNKYHRMTDNVNAYCRYYMDAYTVVVKI
jgi:hypothetical protein